ncbi:MAG: hypothetical protein HN348_03625 [Proteobacteria bacterium]|jgi:hypothetical protein|nr:hypothetical protein [Pseudomonadota bacterium]
MSKTLSLLLLIPLLAGGCKKKVEEAPPIEEGPPPVKITLPSATYSGPKAGTANPGTINVTVGLRNNRPNMVNLRTVALQVYKGGKQICSGKDNPNIQVDPEARQTANIAINCHWVTFGGPEFTVKGVLTYVNHKDKEFEERIAEKTMTIK